MSEKAPVEGTAIKISLKMLQSPRWILAKLLDYKVLGIIKGNIYDNYNT